MNRTNKRVTTRFEPDTRFNVKPAPAAPFRANQENELEGLKNRLLQERLARINETELHARLRRAASEAAAVAWLTTFPLLVFPALFEEFAHTALLQAGQQAYVRKRSREWLVA
jgi:hypothetical protein